MGSCGTCSTQTSPPERARVVGALIGADGGHLSPGEELWSLDEAIPDDSAAAIALIEHRWAIGTRDAIRAAGGVAVADAWVHPADLASAGLVDVEERPPTGASSAARRR